MGSRRTQRLASLILAELSETLRRKVRDPRVAMVSLTGVDVSPDLRQAKVFFSVLDDAKVPEAQAGLNACAAFLRRELAQALHLKIVPKLVPQYDPSLAGGVRMDRLIDEALAHDQEVGGQAGPEEETE